MGTLNFDNIEGFILNIPSDYKLGGFTIPFNLHRKHWITIKRVGDQYYNLDSKLKNPEELGDDWKAKAYLRTQLLEKERELLLIVTPDVSKDNSWRIPEEE